MLFRSKSTSTATIKDYLKSANKKYNYDLNKLYDEIISNGISMSWFVRFTVNGPLLVQQSTIRWVNQYSTYMKGDPNDIYNLLADNIVSMWTKNSAVQGSMEHTKLSMGFFPAGTGLKNILGQS